MSCCALNENTNYCRNWSLLDSPYCYVHRHMTPHLFKERWIEKYLVGRQGYPTYTLMYPKIVNTILDDLQTGKVILTKEDIQKIPFREAYVDIYLLLLQNNFATFGDHPRLEFVGLWLYCYILYNFPFIGQENQVQSTYGILKQEIEKHLILSSGKALYKFLEFMGGTTRGRRKLMQRMDRVVPSFLDSDAAKEMSWMSYDELDKLRITYEQELGKENILTKCLVQRWLLDIKELYHAEKQIQKIKMDQCKEELMMVCWHPDRVSKLLYAGIDPEDM
jgi:hypothetical protein